MISCRLAGREPINLISQWRLIPSNHWPVSLRRRWHRYSPAPAAFIHPTLIQAEVLFSFMVKDATWNPAAIKISFMLHPNHTHSFQPPARPQMTDWLTWPNAKVITFDRWTGMFLQHNCLNFEQMRFTPTLPVPLATQDTFLRDAQRIKENRIENIIGPPDITCLKISTLGYVWTTSYKRIHFDIIAMLTSVMKQNPSIH